MALVVGNKKNNLIFHLLGINRRGKSNKFIYFFARSRECVCDEMALRTSHQLMTMRIEIAHCYINIMHICLCAMRT